jgi:hypothetical protein
MLLLEVFEVKVMEILHWLALYSMISRPETSNICKINQIEQKIEEYQ